MTNDMSEHFTDAEWEAQQEEFEAQVDAEQPHISVIDHGLVVDAMMREWEEGKERGIPQQPPASEA